MPFIVLPPEYKLWRIVYHHPGRTGGETEFYVLSRGEPTEEELTTYAAEMLGEEFDQQIESFDVEEVDVSGIVKLDDLVDSA